MLKLLSGLLLLFGFLSDARAVVIKDDQAWFNLNAFYKLDEHWQAYGEYQPRFFDHGKYNAGVLHRAAIGRDLGLGFSGWFGYGLISWNSRPQSKFPARSHHEDRPFLMLMHASGVGDWKVSNRTRFEHRMFRHSGEASRRFRHLLRVQRKFGDRPWALVAWDEWFYNTNDIAPSSRSHAPVTREGFDQNRAFLGVAYFFGESQQHALETGFMNNYVQGARSDRNASVWMTTLTGRF